MKHEAVAKVFEKEMDRRQFFAYVGAAFLAVVGVTGLIKTLLDFDDKPKHKSGYSASSYGGKSK